jgi:endonuclease YncB( thermonuclease family)
VQSVKGLNENERLGVALAAGVCLGIGISRAGSRIAKGSQRYLVVDDVPRHMFLSQKSTLKGHVVKVTDGDTFRVMHAPSLSMLSRSVAPKTKLSESTLQIRLGGVECPETAKFGNQGQPGGEEATQFLRELVEGKPVTITLLGKDQYARIVGMGSVGRWPFRKDISSALLSAGHATIYRQGGAEYGGLLSTFERLEAKAKASKVGLWASGKTLESAAAYKKRSKAKSL